MSEETPKTQVPPYLSWKTFGTYIESLQQALPPRIDTSGMVRLAGGVRGPMLNSLKFLKLIQDDGTPEAELRNLVDASSPDKREVFRGVLSKVLEAAYPSLFDKQFDLPNATPAQFREKFEELGITGETVRKAEKFFLDAAKDAGVKVSPIVLDARKKGPKAGATPKAKGTKKKDSYPETNYASASEVDPVKQAMLEKFPEFNPEWEASVQEKWFEMYGRLLKIASDDEE